VFLPSGGKAGNEREEIFFSPHEIKRRVHYSAILFYSLRLKPHFSVE
jgi:hypothetical protein